MVSHNPSDIAEGYCGACDFWTREVARVLEAGYRDCDFALIETTMVLVGFNVRNATDVVTPWAEQLMANLPHDQQVFWLGECNCDGHLN